MKQIIIFFGFVTLLLMSCNNEHIETQTSEIETVDSIISNKTEINTTDNNVIINQLANHNAITISQKHDPNIILCDLDGDNLSDTVQIVLNSTNEKYGLRIIFGNGKITYFGMGKEVLGQDFDDLDWVGKFEVAPKGEVYFNNVNGGEIITEEEVQESDKIKLPNDGIYIHADESCGGGIIYLNNGRFEWIQQE